MAIGWVGRIMGAALIMIVPGVFGKWLDNRYDTSFLELVGFALGLVAGIGSLILMTRQIGDDFSSRKRSPSSSGHKAADRQDDD